MATRRTTMRSRTGTKLYAVRDSGGKFKDVQSFRRAHAADLHHVTAAEVGARLDAVEKKLTRATHSVANVFRGSMNDAVDAGKVVRSSMKQAVTAVTRASRRIAKRFSAAAQAARPMGKPVASAGRRMAAKPARRLAA